MSQKRFAASDTKFSVVVVALGLVVTLLGLGFTSIISSQQSTIQNDQVQVQALQKTISQLNSSSGALSGGAYTLTIVVANNMNQTFDPAMGPVPQYFVLGPKGLTSSADISVPVNTTIKLVVVCYDDGANNVSSTLATVSGTVNDSMVIFNGTSPTPANYVGAVRTVPDNEFVSHTFTITSLGINVPIPSSSIVVTYLRFNSTGTYTWNCFSPCIGEPFMQTVPGYMEGSFTVT